MTPGVPIERSALGLLYVQGELDGTPLRMIVDTGANRTILDKGAADRLGVDAGPELLPVVGCLASAASEAAVGALRLGPVAVSLDAVAILDLSPMAPKLGEGVDGIIGADLLVATGAVIDYGTSELRMAYLAPGTAEA